MEEEIEYFEDGSIKSTVPLKDKKPHGMKKWFRKNGTIQAIGEYLNGIQKGKFIVYNEDDSHSIEVDYLNGLKHGKYVQTDAMGVLAVEGQYCNGEMIGKFTYYLPDGSIYKTEEY